MLKMILLQLSPVKWEISVVQEVMRQVVADISEDTTTKDGCCHRPIPIENEMRKLPEWCGKGQE
jgi:hypothetical protein